MGVVCMLVIVWCVRACFCVRAYVAVVVVVVLCACVCVCMCVCVCWVGGRIYVAILSLEEMLPLRLYLGPS